MDIYDIVAPGNLEILVDGWGHKNSELQMEWDRKGIIGFAKFDG